MGDAVKHDCHWKLRHREGRCMRQRGGVFLFLKGRRKEKRRRKRRAKREMPGRGERVGLGGVKIQ